MSIENCSLGVGNRSRPVHAEGDLPVNGTSRVDLDSVSQPTTQKTMKHSFSRSLLRGLAALAVLSAIFIQPSRAEYPDRPIKYVMSAAVGSAPDTLMRLVLADVAKRLGTPIVFDTRVGAGGTIAMQAIASAAPDGYTIGHGNTQTLGVNPGLSRAGMALAHEVELIVQVGYTANILSVTPSLPVNSVKELIAHAKANPGKTTFGSGGNGTANHVGGELLNSVAGIKMVHVPYKGGPAAVNDVMAGHINMVLDNVAGSLPNIKAGKLKALAITSARRSPLLPNVPTMSETLPGFEIISWSGLIGPKGMPAAVAQKLNAAVNQTLREPQIIESMRELGYEVVGGTPADFTAWVYRERTKWEQVIKFSGATSN